MTRRFVPRAYLEGRYPYDPFDLPYELVIAETAKQARRLCKRVLAAPGLHAHDTETDGADPDEHSPAGRAIPVSAQVAWREGKTIVCGWANLRKPGVLEALRPLWEAELRPDQRRLFHNAPWDRHALANVGIIVRGPIEDTLALARAQDAERDNTLDGARGLVATLLHEQRLTTNQALQVANRGVRDDRELKTSHLPTMGEYVDDPEGVVFQRAYSTLDVYDTIRLYPALRKLMAKMPWPGTDLEAGDPRGLYAFYDQHGRVFLDVLHAMERHGIAVDEGWAGHLQATFQARCDELDEQLWRWAGAPINWDSPPQKTKLFYSDESFTVTVGKGKQAIEYTVQGKNLPCDPAAVEDVERGWSTMLSTGREHIEWTIEALHEEDPDSDDAAMLEVFLERQRLGKLLSGTLNPLTRNLLDAHATGMREFGMARFRYIHGSLNWAARTGRLTSSHPNLQNIPVHGPFGGIIRDAFVCEDHEMMLVADFKQIELRILAVYLKVLFDDSSLAELLDSGADLHAETAKLMGLVGKYTAELGPVEGPKRARHVAKSINFGLLYGKTAGGLARQLRITRREAEMLIARHAEVMPGFAAYCDWAEDFAAENGHVRTLFDRYRRLPGARRRLGEAMRQARNTPIQGSAQDVVMAAMIAVHNNERLRELGFRMICQVHDEIVSVCPAANVAEAERLFQETLEGAIDPATVGGVRFPVDLGRGKTWREGKEGANGLEGIRRVLQEQAA